ncbi:MAG: hypothetical protein KDJ19_09585 [Hyphomicrobiaceae bacterium]|nr:hypothetical protein [Hyphomicrobiaceae bacterium]MCC0024707.1 hypothetical protein [Hyphomicrobiaceae bacterium]
MVRYVTTVAKGATLAVQDAVTLVEKFVDADLRSSGQTSTSFSTKIGKYVFKVEGKGFSYNGDTLASGTIQSITAFKSGEKLATFKGKFTFNEMAALYQAESTNSDKFAFENFFMSKNWVFDARKGASADDYALGVTKVGDGALFQPNGNDIVYLANGNDVFYAGAGNDEVYGGKGNDWLSGGKGKDLLDGGRQNDTLQGRQNADKFVFGKNYDRDKIIDFENNKDTVVLDDNLWKGTKSVNKVLNQFGHAQNGDFILDFGGGDVLTIYDVTKNQLKDDVQIV